MKKTFKKCATALIASASLCFMSLTAFADDASAGATSTDGGTATTGNPILYYGVMIGLFLLVGYFFLIRPEKKRKKEADDLKSSLRPGNRITTIGGIVGTVEKITDEEIYLTNGLVLKRWALRSIDETAPEEGNAAVTYYEEDEESSDK
jgi:preprotein translocase subunit YajC